MKIDHKDSYKERKLNSHTLFGKH